MALPVILFNTSTGSDTAASGAGPGTALTGSSASTSASGLVVTLDGSPDLSGVATDGSHAIYLADSTAGARNWGKITAVDNGADTVTVSDAFRTSASGLSWAIGGKRLTLDSTTSRKLLDNNSGNGDAMPGWILEFESAFTDTITANLRIRRAGDVTSGPITVRGASGAATVPVLTANFNGTLFTSGAGNYHHFMDFEVQNTNGTKTAAHVFSSGSGGLGLYARRIKCAHATNYFGRFMSTVANRWTAEECDIGYCSLAGAILITGVDGMVKNCYLHHMTSHAIEVANPNHGRVRVLGNVFNDITGNCVRFNGIGSGSTGSVISQNTMYDLGNDAIDIVPAIQGFSSMLIENNIISSVTGYGIRASGASVDEVDFRSEAVLIRNNTLHSCSSGTFSPTNLANWAEGTLTSDPVFANTGTLNFGIGSAAKATGFSELVLPGTATRSYIDRGAAQREEPAGGGGGGGPLIGGRLVR